MRDALLPGRLLLGAIRAVRYRFFLFAGLMPYVVGAAWARWHAQDSSSGDTAAFWLGLAGVGCTVVGVEAFNEYFDSRLGTDRVFNPTDDEPVSVRVFWLGVAAFGAALVVGVALVLRVGAAIVPSVVIGALAAAFYVGPPLRLVYRGLGEVSIALAYGPAMVLGGAALQGANLLSDGVHLLPLSLVPGFLIMALAVSNAVPDYVQDRLVGKRNLVVRIGPRRGVLLAGALASTGALLLIGCALLGVAPPAAALGAVIACALVARAVRRALPVCERPRKLATATRLFVLAYLLAVGGLLVSLCIGVRGSLS